MKFKIIIVTDKTNRNEFIMEGDLGTVKTYVKLASTESFTWGAVERIDELESGDISHWIIQHNRRDNCLEMDPFKMYGVDGTDININLFSAAFRQCNGRKGLGAVREILGGASF